MEELKEDREIAVIEKETLPIKEKIMALDIKDESSLHLGATYLSFIAKASKRLEERRVHFTKPILESKKVIDNFFRERMTVLESMDRELKNKINEYNSLRQARENEKANQVEKFAKDNNLPVPAKEAVVAKPVATKTAVGTVFSRKFWAWKVQDANKVPREYLVIDEKKINAVMRGHTNTIKGVTTMDLKIEGIEFYQDEDVSVRT